ncbi:winged helix DNA-binding domain-containing protein [Agromyces sp. G08B096]|uniref:Winged helix DNA-binding domain-containing protein n=1 Tax=Agromyces sp. G08B096 TaxID=3156399 RepID=A0AAU7W5H4_9MICO
MDAAELRSRRLFAQGLRGEADPAAPVGTAAEVVRRSLAVQAQEYLPAQWGLAQRIAPAARPDAAAVAGAIDGGEILRTHVLRPTWHFLHRDDARWVIGLSAERVHRANGTMYRQTGVAADTAARCLDVLAAAVAGGRHRTRGELAEELAAADLPSTSVGLAYAIMHAELERVLISGAGRGAQRTYAAFDERVPPAPDRPRGEALAELAERFLLTRGPASAKDLSTWSGFTLNDSRAALLEAAERTGGRIERVAGEDDLWLDQAVAAAWSARPAERARADDDASIVDLVQAYDEVIMGYAAPRSFLQPPGRAPVMSEFPLHAMLAGGVMAGRWAPAVRGRRATVRIVPWRRMTRAELRSRDARIAEVEAFLGRPVDLEVEPVAPA